MSVLQKTVKANRAKIVKNKKNMYSLLPNASLQTNTDKLLRFNGEFHWQVL